MISKGLTQDWLDFKTHSLNHLGLCYPGLKSDPDNFIFFPCNLLQFTKHWIGAGSTLCSLPVKARRRGRSGQRNRFYFSVWGHSHQCFFGGGTHVVLGIEPRWTNECMLPASDDKPHHRRHPSMISIRKTNHWPADLLKSDPLCGFIFPSCGEVGPLIRTLGPPLLYFVWTGRFHSQPPHSPRTWRVGP